MYREKMKSYNDATVFNQTARKTKKVNVAPKIMRGGIRL